MLVHSSTSGCNRLLQLCWLLSLLLLWQLLAVLVSSGHCVGIWAVVAACGSGVLCGIMCKAVVLLQHRSTAMQRALTLHLYPTCVFAHQHSQHVALHDLSTLAPPKTAPGGVDYGALSKSWQLTASEHDVWVLRCAWSWAGACTCCSAIQCLHSISGRWSEGVPSLPECQSQSRRACAGTLERSRRCCGFTCSV